MTADISIERNIVNLREYFLNIINKIEDLLRNVSIQEN